MSIWFRAARRPALIIHKGFTLIELLIVFAILAILSAMLFPVFAAARERGRQASCIQSERQMGLALLQYLQDYDERLPSGTTGSVGQGWAGQIYPYVKNAQLYRCPDDNDKGEDAAAGLLTISYALNSNTAGTSYADFTAPSLTVFLFEVNDAAAGMTAPETLSPTGRGLPTDNCPDKCGKPFGADYYATGNIGNVTPPLSTTLRPYHSPTSNYLAADGHVRSLRPEAISPGLIAPSPSSPADPNRRTAAGTETLMTPAARAALTFSTR